MSKPTSSPGSVPAPQRAGDHLENRVAQNGADRNGAENKYAHLPPRVRREDLRTSQDVVDHPEVVGEADRERAWLLRTTGLFL